MAETVSTGWEKTKIISGIIASVLIPLVIAFVGQSINKSIKDNEISLQYVELAVKILSETPTDEKENLRVWAIDVINNFSDVKLSEGARTELRRETLPVANGNSNPLPGRIRDILDQPVEFDTENFDYGISQHILIKKDGLPVNDVPSPNLSERKLKNRLVIFPSTAALMLK